MTPGEFIAKLVVELKERSASHFNDLCALVGEPSPPDAGHRAVHDDLAHGYTLNERLAERGRREAREGLDLPAWNWTIIAMRGLRPPSSGADG